VLPVVISLAGLLVVAETLAAHSLVGDSTEQVLTAGVAGLATYLGVRGLGEFFEARGLGEAAEALSGAAVSDEHETAAGTVPGQASTDVAKPVRHGPNGLVLASGRAAFFLFLYLEVLDASFSFDGVVGAFAISQNIFIIAAGLGIGALYIRSITVYLVRKGTLSEYIYLEHGAHYAIGALAVILAVSIRYEVPEIITGLIGVGFILVALLSSIRHRRANPSDGGDLDGGDSGGSGDSDGAKEPQPAFL
nr:DUF475 domain-containing protein [Micromonospora sp. DSM 115978]